MKDKIYLLSIKEYKKYKDKIPHINCWWWLRSPGLNSYFAANVSFGGSVSYYGTNVYYVYGAVRPVIKLEHNNLIGDRIVKYDFPWIVIDNDLAIAETPISFMPFGDDDNYEISYIREFLLNWIQER